MKADPSSMPKLTDICTELFTKVAFLRDMVNVPFWNQASETLGELVGLECNPHVEGFLFLLTFCGLSQIAKWTAHSAIH